VSPEGGQGGELTSIMREKETLKYKVKHLWKKAGLPKFLNRFGPKKTPGWITYLCHLEYTTHAPSWRRASNFMIDYHQKSLHWTSWQKAIQKWPQSVWDKLALASAGQEACEIAAIDGTTISRSNPSQHYMNKIGTDLTFARPIQNVIMIDVKRRKFLSWRVRAKPRGEKCDVKYLIKHSPALPELVLMDKGFDSEPLHNYLRERGIYSISPVRKNCKRGRYRKQLRDCFDWTVYWQRNLVECLFSAIKRLFGSHTRARTARTQRAELNSRFIAYNIGAKMITTFYRAPSSVKLIYLFDFSENNMLEEKSIAPDFELLDQNSTKHKLSAYKGKWVLVYFYPKDDTPGCVTEGCAIRDEFDSFKNAGIIVLGVSADTVESHKRFQDKYGLPFPLLSDPTRKVIKQYDADGLIFTRRISYLISPQGKIAKAYAKVYPEGHAKQVLADVTELSA